ncbi:MAG: DUF1015 family protein [Holosporales bacterium]|jgi:uncharacterized protein (DUF1015 family)|nr:DUF1015 family protein [Holosporales bacterium]
MKFINDKIAKGIAKIDNTPGYYIINVGIDKKDITLIVGEIAYDDLAVFQTSEELYIEKLNFYKNIFSKYKLQINPALAFYDSDISIKTLILGITSANPNITTEINGIIYKLWQVSNPKDILRIRDGLAPIKKLYIADGHHRYAMFNESTMKTSARLIVSITDMNSILLRSCHRVVTGTVSPMWRDNLGKSFKILDANCDTECGGNVQLVFKSGKIYELIQLENSRAPIHEIVKKEIIKVGFEIDSYNENVFPIPGNLATKDSAKVFDLYQSCSVIIFVPNVKMSDFLNVVSVGKKLPPTSTWFEPKLVDGFLIRKYDR